MPYSDQREHVHEVQQGAQGASRVEPGKSGLHVHGEGERVIALVQRVAPTTRLRLEFPRVVLYARGTGGQSFYFLMRTNESWMFDGG